MFSSMLSYPPVDSKWAIEMSDACITQSLKDEGRIVRRSSEVSLLIGLEYAMTGAVLCHETELPSDDRLEELRVKTGRKISVRNFPYMADMKVMFFTIENTSQIKDSRGVSYRHHMTYQNFEKIRAWMEEDAKNMGDHDVSLKSNGKLRSQIKAIDIYTKNIPYSIRSNVNTIDDLIPDVAMTDKSQREAMGLVLTYKEISVSDEAKAEIQRAQRSYKSGSTPLMPITDFEALAWADEQEKLKCHTTNVELGFTAGREYTLQTKTFRFEDTFTRDKAHYSATKGTYMLEHQCKLVGQDRMLIFYSDSGKTVRYMDRPPKTNYGYTTNLQEMKLWDTFEKPDVKTIVDVSPEIYASNLATLETHSMLAGFTYMPGQKDYIARISCRDYALPAAETGAGKTLMALSLVVLKNAKRTLIIAPQGTLREGKDTLSQWKEEIKKFAPYYPIHELYNRKDLDRLQDKEGHMPEGLYITYYEAFFQVSATGVGDRAREMKGANSKFNTKHIMDGLYPKRNNDSLKSSTQFLEGIGAKTKEGIQCIAFPSMSTIIGHKFDAVFLDEAHKIVNLESTTTNACIKLQPRYRFAFTASPVTNHAGNLFSLMGWLCVKDWYKGGRKSAAWPFPREASSKFNSTFLSTEHDLTELQLKRVNSPGFKGNVSKTSPIISLPTRLLKLIKPTLAFIDKNTCNPAYVSPTIKEVRVPLGLNQAKLYGHYMDRGNITKGTVFTKAALQMAYLRNICCDPATCDQNDVQDLQIDCTSNFTPKVVAILEVIKECLSRGEQCVVINARKGISEELAQRLNEADVPYSRVDSSVGSNRYAEQSHAFKAKETAVMLMGIKCAEGHSYDQCPNAVIGSLEYSYSSFQQAKGRVDRLFSKGANVYVILHKATIEEVMFDTVATKGDSAELCLQGNRLPRNWKPADAGEILAQSIMAFDSKITETEEQCELKWPGLRESMRGLKGMVR
jgi:superfamily II DNA or RNA helicase